MKVKNDISMKIQVSRIVSNEEVLEDTIVRGKPSVIILALNSFLKIFKVMRSSDLSGFESVCFDREIEVEPQKLIIYQLDNFNPKSLSNFPVI